MRSRGWIGIVIFVFLMAVSALILGTARERATLTWAEQAVYEAISPVQAAVHGAVRSVTSIFSDLAALRTTKAENERLHREIGELRTERDALIEAGRQNEALRELMDIPALESEHIAVAEIIARSPNNWLGSVTINKGRNHGVEPGMAVIAAEGVVGKVRHVTARTAEIVLLTDARSAIGGRIRGSEHLVLVEGTNNPTDQNARVRLLTWEADLSPGDIVVTSELSRTFPKGLPIGRVEEVEDHGPGTAPTATLQPFVDLSRLEWVIVLQAPHIETPWWDDA